MSAIAAVFVITVFSAPGTAAFSAYGAGTESNPYRVATCSQLQEMSGDLAGYYVLVSNIDCTGFTFTAIGSTFTGTLDGKSHTIKALSITEPAQGLFSESDGATIKNVTLQGGSVGSANAVGSFVGTATDTTLRNVHSSMTVIGDSRAGGLVGQSISGITIDQSSYSGDLTAVSSLGGLMGLIYDEGVNTISNSYFDGTLYVSMASFPFTNPGTTAGGLVGLLYEGTITNSYSIGTIDFDEDTLYVGGLVGLTYHGTFTNLFAASPIIGTSGVDIGAAFGLFYGGAPYTSSATNVQFDSGRVPLSCAAFTTGSGLSCTARNASNSAPNYFKNNATNPPFTSWNFSTVWTTTSEYPTLRTMATYEDTSGTPNAGDANADGINDSYQANVLSLQDGNGVWVTVTVPLASGCTLGNGASTNAQSTVANSNYVSLTNLAGFSVYCKNPHTSVAVTVIYDKQYSNPQLHFYNTNTATYSTVSGATFATQTIGGTARTTVTYSLTDGGPLDLDGTANGIIIDPIGLSVQTGVPNTGSKPVELQVLVAIAVAGIGLTGLAALMIGRLLKIRA